MVTFCRRNKQQTLLMQIHLKVDSNNCFVTHFTAVWRLVMKCFDGVSPKHWAYTILLLMNDRCSMSILILYFYCSFIPVSNLNPLRKRENTYFGD